jgi:plasmid stabilization system protein ParE
MLHRIDDAIRTLSHAPYRGESQSKLNENVRRIIVGNYLVFYEATPADVRIMRVFHAAQRWEDLLYSRMPFSTNYLRRQ